jgi:hypothetical protein
VCPGEAKLGPCCQDPSIDAVPGLHHLLQLSCLQIPWESCISSHVYPPELSDTRFASSLEGLIVWERVNFSEKEVKKCLEQIPIGGNSQTARGIGTDRVEEEGTQEC